MTDYHLEIEKRGEFLDARFEKAKQEADAKIAATELKFKKDAYARYLRMVKQAEECDVPQLAKNLKKSAESSFHIVVGMSAAEYAKTIR